jgi:hypothetical protein
MRGYEMGALKGFLTATPTFKLHVHTFQCYIPPLYCSLRLVNENHSSSKTAHAVEIFDFLPFLDLLYSLSRACRGGAGGGVSSSITISRSGLSIVRCLTDSNESLDVSSESLDSLLAESLLNSESD